MSSESANPMDFQEISVPGLISIISVLKPSGAAPKNIPQICTFEHWKGGGGCGSKLAEIIRNYCCQWTLWYYRSVGNGDDKRCRKVIINYGGLSSRNNRVFYDKEPTDPWVVIFLFLCLNIFTRLLLTPNLIPVFLDPQI